MEEVVPTLGAQELQVKSLTAAFSPRATSWTAMKLDHCLGPHMSWPMTVVHNHC